MVVSKFYLSAAPWCKQTLEWAIPEKDQTAGGVEDILLWKLPQNFSYSFTWSLEIPDKTKLNAWIFHTILLPRSLRNSKAKKKDPWKFHIIFSWSPLEIPRAISLIPLEIPYPQPPPVWIFSGIAQLVLISYIWLFFIIYQ